MAGADKISYGQSEAARDFVREMREKISVDDPASEYLVEQLAAIRDAIEEARARISADGAFVKDRFGRLQQHPACVREKALLNEYGKLFRLLGLDQAASDQGRLGF
jgi:hypothetical protein